MFLSLLLTGCPGPFSTDDHRLELQPTNIVTDPLEGFAPDGNPLLVGTTLCLDATAKDDTAAAPEGAEDCYVPSVSGAGSLEEGCVHADEAGALVLRYEAQPCDVEGYTAVSDQVTLGAVSGGAVSGDWDQWLEVQVSTWYQPSEGAWPDDWIQPAAEPYRIVEGGGLRLPVILRHPDWSSPAAWNADDAVVAAVTHAGRAPIVSMPEPGQVEVRPFDGTEATITVSIGENTWEIAEIRGVSESSVKDLELVIAQAVELDSATVRAPVGARAVARDRDGHLVFGLPVSWKVTEGSLAVQPEEGLPGPDYAWISDSCIAPENNFGTRTARVKVSHGWMSDAADVTWLAERGDKVAGWTPNEYCQDGCGCGPGGGVSGIGGVGATLGMMALARRRRSRP